MKKSLTIASFFLTGLFLTSLDASAQSATAVTVGQGIGTFAGLISGFTATVVKAVGGLFMAGAMVAFFFGIVQYIWGAREGDAKKIANGNMFIRWSLVALFVMFSVYGIVRFGQGFICGGPCDNTITVPSLDFGSAPAQGGVRVPSGSLPTGGGSTVTAGEVREVDPNNPTSNAPIDSSNEPDIVACKGKNEGNACSFRSPGTGGVIQTKNGACVSDPTDGALYCEEGASVQQTQTNSQATAQPVQQTAPEPEPIRTSKTPRYNSCSVAYIQGDACDASFTDGSTGAGHCDTPAAAGLQYNSGRLVCVPN